MTSNPELVQEPSAPCGNSELFDFDEIEKLECRCFLEDESAARCASASKEHSYTVEKCFKNAAYDKAPLNFSLHKRDLQFDGAQLSTVNVESPHPSDLHGESCEASRIEVDVFKPTGDFQIDYDAVKLELELEASAERRRLEAENGRERRGSLIKIVPGRRTGCCKQEERRFFCDEMNLVLSKIHRLLTNQNRVVELGAQTLEPRLVRLEILLSLILPQVLSCEAQHHFERLLGIFVGKRGICELAQVMCNPSTSFSCSMLACRKIGGLLKESIRLMSKLRKCIKLSDASTSDMHILMHIDRHLEVASTDAGDIWLDDLVEWRTKIMKHRSGDSVQILRTSSTTITQLLYELRAEFQADCFQNHYKELRSQAKQQGDEAHAKMIAWTFEFQKRVLPKYGFEPTSQGVWQMRGESGIHADGIGEGLSGDSDKIVDKLREDIHLCLDMDSCKQQRLPLFHTVGDSHSRFGWPSCVIQHWQGPLLCYNVDRVDLRQLEPPIREGDAICLCFGEIDCRCHVYKHCQDSTPFESVINSIIEKYFAHLQIQVKLLPQGVRIFVYNVPPPVRRGDAEENPAFPYLGTDEERKSYVLYFNRKLQIACRQTGFRFFDIYDRYTDEQGFLCKEYSDGNVHIADGVWIEEVIRGLNLKPTRLSEINFERN